MIAFRQVDLVYRSYRLRAKPAALVFDKIVDRMLSRTAPQANLAQLDSGKGQDLRLQRVYRPILAKGRAR